jgi:hypothetical protein
MAKRPIFDLPLNIKELRALGLVATHWAILEIQTDNYLAVILRHKSVAKQFKDFNLLTSFKDRLKAWARAEPAIYARYPALLARSAKVRTSLMEARRKRDQIVHGAPRRLTGNQIEFAVVRFKQTIQKHTLQMTPHIWDLEGMLNFAVGISQIRQQLALLLAATTRDVLHPSPRKLRARATSDPTPQRCHLPTRPRRRGPP